MDLDIGIILAYWPLALKVFIVGVVIGFALMLFVDWEERDGS